MLRIKGSAWRTDKCLDGLSAFPALGPSASGGRVWDAEFYSGCLGVPIPIILLLWLFFGR